MSDVRDAMRSGGDADFTAPAELIGYPARSAMLLALLDGRALPMSMLAGEAGVAVSTASAGTRALRLARTCYDHVAGHLGVAIMRSLLERDAVVGGDGLHHPGQAKQDRLSAPGQDHDYRLTDPGWELFAHLGVVVPEGQRRRLVGYCVDWTEQRHHLAGAAGTALLTRFEQLEWIQRGVRGVPRALGITEAGQRGFAEHFGIDTATLAVSEAA